MRIAVVGGTGMIGSEVVRKLAGDGHEVRILSRKPPVSPVSGATHHPIDLHSRDGIDAAISGVETLIDAANDRRTSRQVFVKGTRDLLQRCEAASVAHYVGISIVGCEKLGMDYYVAKTAQEEVIKASPIGWSLLRASQFHELLEAVFVSAGKFRISPTGPIPLQTIAASVVAERLAELAVNQPLEAVEAIAGPQVEDLGTMSRTWRKGTGRSCLPLRLWIPGKTGRALRKGALTDVSATTPGPNFAEWLAARGG